LPTFAYQALTAAGERVRGEIEAADARSAIQRLQDGGLIPIDARPTAAAPPPSMLSDPRRIGVAKVTAATRELSTLIGAGQTVEAALEMTAEDAGNRRLAAALARVLAKVRGGTALADALAEEPRFFPPVYVAMVRAGEAAGRLDRTLAELVTLRERSEAMRSKLTSALLYPTLLVLTAIGALGILLTVVVPQFAPMFAQAGAELPASSRVVLGIAEWVQTNGTTLLVVLLLLLLIGGRLYRAVGPGRAIDRLLLGLPGLGRLLRERVTAQLCRGLSTLLGGGLDLPAALGLSRNMVDNRFAQARIEAVILGVRQGRTLSECLAEADILAPLAVRLLRAGEEGGRLREVAGHLAEAFDERVATRLTRLVTILEPTLVIGLGIMVGGIVMSILTAVISVNELAL
jgi:general secretion pathway protein F